MPVFTSFAWGSFVIASGSYRLFVELEDGVVERTPRQRTTANAPNAQTLVFLSYFLCIACILWCASRLVLILIPVCKRLPMSTGAQRDEMDGPQ